MEAAARADLETSEIVVGQATEHVKRFDRARVGPGLAAPDPDLAADDGGVRDECVLRAVQPGERDAQSGAGRGDHERDPVPLAERSAVRATHGSPLRQTDRLARLF